MAELDPNIPLAAKMPQINSPVQTMGEMYKLQQDKNIVQGQQLENKQRQLDLDQRTKDAADEAALREELKNAQQPDGSYDVGGAVNRLMKLGHGQAALKLQSTWTDHQMKQTQLSEAQLKEHAAELDMMANMLYGVKDDGTWQVAKKNLLSQKIAPNEANMIQGLPDDYASAKPYIEHLIQAGSTMKEKVDASNRSLQQHMTALRLGIVAPNVAAGERESPDVSKKRLQAEALQTSSMAEMLAQTKNDQEYQQQLKSFQSQQYPKEIINKFMPTWSPDAVKRAENMRLSAKDALSMHMRLEELGLKRESLEFRKDQRNNLTLAQMYQAYDRDRREHDRMQPGPLDTYEKGDTLPAGKRVGDQRVREPFMTRAEYLKEHFGIDENGNDVDDTETPASKAPVVAPGGPPPPVAPPPPPAARGPVARPTAPPPGIVAPPPPQMSVPPPGAAAPVVVAQPSVVAAPPPVMPARPIAPPKKLQVGSIVRTSKGQMARIVAIHPDGSKDIVDAATGKPILK